MNASAATAADAVNPQSNPLLTKSPLPYELPPFDKIRNEHFRPAIEAGMAEQKREIETIANSQEAATFENTIVALERSGELLARANSVFYNLTSSHTNPDLEALRTDLAPKLSAHSDSIYLDPALFARVAALYGKRASLQLDPESLRLLERYHTLFVRAGAKLSEADKTKLKQMNQQLSSLTTQFSQTVLKGVNAAAVVFDKVSDLDGLSQAQIATAAEAARTRKLDGKWVVALLNTTGQPPLAQMTNRAARQRIYEASIHRGWGGEFDTTKLIEQIVALRAERAALLGYPTHAAYVTEDETALTPQAVNRMLAQLAPPAVANARAEAADMQALIDAQAKARGTKPFKLAPWDWDFYAEQVRAAKYSYDESQVRPYFEMNRVLVDGVLFAAHELYGLNFKERKDLPVYQEDVRVFEVANADGSPLGLFLVDWYARDNKRGGAWMNSFVEQSQLLGKKPVVVNNLNIPKPPQGEPTLLTFDEVTTAFHEFGHAVHGLFSDVQYPTFSGTSVPRDFVEFPSQYNEMWATEPRVLANYAKHYQTGAAMPQALMDKVLAAGKFNQGFATTEYLAAAMLDQSWHQLPAGKTPKAADAARFEAAALKTAGVDLDAVPPRYRSTYFSHVFSSPIGYSAGYYAYIWSDVLARDTQHWFKTNGGLTRANGDRLREKILSKGFSVDSLTLFRDFYGKDPDIGPLLESRGLELAK
ncbi:MAG TPA: M3 family metallopeptidase [Povalibacter sp.]|uniref:M3 family metallopeptidase n=1 Tax=Povalibacter sp. TaxID=1962978 RepID=UPI002B9C99C5|nr:M3 family metallopeptidase [Povalibacter sp.]HMN45119.1 M3 family metallopeptidase [Povalibacter sp.]